VKLAGEQAGRQYRFVPTCSGLCHEHSVFRWRTSAACPELARGAGQARRLSHTGHATYASLEVDGQSADVLLRRGIEAIEQERRILSVRELEAEEHFQIERKMERLRHPHVHAFAAVIAARNLRLLDAQVGDGDRRSGREENRLEVAGDV